MSLKALSLTSSVVKAFGQLIVFLLIATSFSAEDFGVFAFYLAVAGLLAAVGDFGISTYSLPVMAKAGAGVGVAYHNFFIFRLRILAPTILIGGGCVYLFVGLDKPLLFLLCLGTAFFGSINDYALLPLRAVQRVKAEALACVLSVATYLLLVSASIYIYSTVYAVAAAYMSARVLGCVIVALVWRYARREFNSSGFDISFPDIFHDRVRKVAPFFFDSMLSSAINFLDTLLIGFLLGAAAVGQYQIPAKILQVGMIVVGIAVSIYVPLLAVAKGEVKEATRRRMTLEMLFVGFVGAVLVAFLVPYLMPMFFDHEYQMPLHVWFSFAAVLLLRLVCSSYGIFLIAEGKAKIRIVGEAMLLSSFILGSVVLAPLLGLFGVALAFIFALIVALLFYHHRVVPVGANW